LSLLNSLKHYRIVEEHMSGEIFSSIILRVCVNEYPVNFHQNNTLFLKYLDTKTHKFISNKKISAPTGKIIQWSLVNPDTLVPSKIV
jgi:hypothetical protein